MDSETLTVLFADLAGSTRLYQAEGDIEAHQRVTDSLQRMKFVIENHSGKLLKTIGDAALASFASADNAYRAAVDIQQEHIVLNLSVRIGFHYGEVIPDDGDVYGNAVNVAARVAAFAEANEIYTTEDTVNQLSNEHQSSTHFLDQIDFKGISQPMSVYRIHWASDGGETVIIAAVDNTDLHTTNQALQLLIGEKQNTVDTNNPMITFGRGSDNDIVIDSEMASRNHAKIEFARGRFVLHDSSTNGTYLLRADLSSHFIRRESIVLENFGIIGLGRSPDSISRGNIEFKVISCT